MLVTPYTVEIRHKGYASSNKAWSWGGNSGITVSNGVASGQVIQLASLVGPKILQTH